MFVTGTVNVEVDIDQQSGLIASIIQQDYASLASDTLALYKQFDTLEDYQCQDYYNNIEFLSAMDKVLSYYMLPEKYDQFREKWRQIVEIYKESD